MPTKRQIFSSNLKYLAEKSHLSKSQLADICGVSKGSFSDWIYGRSYPRPEKLALLAKALGVTEYDLTTNVNSDFEKQILTEEMADIVKDLYENPHERALYKAIKSLPDEERENIRRLVMSLSKSQD